MSITSLIAILFVIAAVITVLPRPSAKKKCMLGYRALCTFSPMSTVALLIVAAVVWLIGGMA